MSDSSQGTRSQNKARRQMLTIMAIAFVSLAGSYLLYYFAKSGTSWGTVNNGAFVEPPVSIADLAWRVGDGDEEVERAWYLWVVAADCAEPCQRQVRDLRALHVLLNREADRLRRGFSNTRGTLPGDYWLDEFKALKRIAWQPRKAIGEGIYIADPLGNLVFHYALDVDPKKIQADLKRLLKVSQIG